MRKSAVLTLALAALIFAPSAHAAITDVMSGDVQCETVTAEGNAGSGPALAGSLGQRWCGSLPASATTVLTAPLPTDRSTVKTFDGVPLDVNVAFPPDPSPGSLDTGWPVVGMYHGYGGAKMTFADMQRWLQKGYAVYSVTNRGGHESCQSPGSIAADPAGCADGYVHLMDPRFEVRDTQLFLGKLVDDGVIDPQRIAAWGGSYGGSESLQLAVLKDRTMMPDGRLVPWKSPNGTPMSLAVGTPEVPWSDLIQSLAPNGGTLDYLRDGKFTGVGGVMKESYVNGLYVSRRVAPMGQDPSADLAKWRALLSAGEPYTSADNRAMFDEITRFHSGYYTDHSQAPAPLLMSSGFTDDLFPVDEVLRFYNRTRALYPNTPMAVFAGSFGHARGQNQGNVMAAQAALTEQWIDHYLKGVGQAPASTVTAYTQTCPDGTAGDGPFTATDWASIAPGEIVVRGAGAQTVAASGGVPATALAWNPLSGGTTACTIAPEAPEPGSAVYQTDPAPAGGYTVLGAATVIARFAVANGPDSQVMARLVDLDGAGNKILVARGSWRAAASGRQVFQLHPGAWKVEPGHRLRLELLPRDAYKDPPGALSNYARPSNHQEPVTVSQLELRIPVTERPGSLGGLVKRPAKKVLPDRAGAKLAPGYERIGAVTLATYENGAVTRTGKVKIKGRQLTARFRCAGPESGAARCAPVKVLFKGAPKGRNAKGKNVKLAAGRVTVPAGKTKTVRLKLTNPARKLFRDSRKKVRKRGKVKTKKVKGLKKLRTRVMIGGKNAGFVLARRNGRVR